MHCSEQMMAHFIGKEEVFGSVGISSPTAHIKNGCQKITSPSSLPGRGQEVENIHFCFIPHEAKSFSLYQPFLCTILSYSYKIPSYTSLAWIPKIMETTVTLLIDAYIDSGTKNKQTKKMYIYVLSSKMHSLEKTKRKNHNNKFCESNEFLVTNQIQ